MNHLIGGTVRNPRKHLISKTCFLFSNSSVKVHDSQAYRNIKMARERIIFTFDQGDKLSSLQIGFSFVRAGYLNLLTSCMGFCSQVNLMPCICAISFPGALSSTKLLWLRPQDPLIIDPLLKFNIYIRFRQENKQKNKIK